MSANLHSGFVVARLPDPFCRDVNEYTPMPRHMNERDKLRKFRELDDAFAQALRELDGGASRHEKEEEKEEVVANSPGFEDRLHSLMNEYALTRVNVHEMLSTLIEYRRIS